MFYKIHSTVRCSTKYHWKLFYKIHVTNRHLVVFCKTKYPLTLGGILNQKSTPSAKLSDSLCVIKNSICRVLRTVECVLMSLSTKSQRWQRLWMLGNDKHMIVRLNHTRGYHTHTYSKWPKRPWKSVVLYNFNLPKTSFNAFELTSRKCFVSLLYQTLEICKFF